MKSPDAFHAEVIFPNGTSIYKDFVRPTWGDINRQLKSNIEQWCRSQLSDMGIYAQRNELAYARCLVNSVEVKEGLIVKYACFDLQVQLYFEPLTEESFEKEQQSLLDILPPKYHSFVRSWAWEHGHSNGYEEVLGIVQDLVYELKQVEKLP